MDTIKLVTPWGIKVEGYYREGRSDKDTLISCIAQDEYNLTQFGFQPGDIAIDLGAHIGAATLAMCSRDMKVIAVEILESNVKMMKMSLALNNYKAIIYHAAISGRSGNIIDAIETKPTDTTGYLHQFIGVTFPHKQLSATVEDGDKYPITTIDLSTIFAANSIDYCHFLKMDCEGSEWDTLVNTSADILKKIGYISGEIHTIQPGQNHFVTHSDLLYCLQDLFIDVTEEYEAVHCKPGLQTHFTYKNRELV